MLFSLGMGLSAGTGTQFVEGRVLGVFYAACGVQRKLPFGSVEATHSVASWDTQNIVTRGANGPV